MSTLTEIYTRIALDTNRDDMGSVGELEQAKIDAVKDAIDANSEELFWFNRKAGSVSTTANTATVAQPTGMLIPLVVNYLGAALLKVRLEDIEGLENATTPVVGPPSKWAMDSGLIHLYPIPDAVYALTVSGIADLGVPSSGSASNAWTVEARALILAEAKIILYRGALRDPDGLALAKDERDEALTGLRRETRRRGDAPMTTDIPVPSAYNILTG